jgi:hypothetical protein
MGDANHARRHKDGLASGNPEGFSIAMYNRTQNENGSYNTRCLDCFMTIASCVEADRELDAREAHHICPERALAELMVQETTQAARTQAS